MKLYIFFIVIFSFTSFLHADPVLEVLNNKVKKEIEVVKEKPSSSPLSEVESLVGQNEVGKKVDRSDPSYSTVAPHFEVEPVSGSKFELLAESIKNNRILDYPDYYTGFIDKSKVVNLEDKRWIENFINITSNIVGMRVLFDYQGDIDPDEHKARSFYVNLEFEEEELVEERLSVFKGEFRYHKVGPLSYSVVAKHSRPKISKEVGGLRIPVTEKQQNRVFLQGQDQTSVAVMLPKVKKKGPRGMLLCPRDYDFWKVKGGSRSMEDTGYELAGVDFQVKSLVQGRVLTGLGPGFASASIQTTENINPSKINYDDSYSVHPFVSVEYLPAESLDQPGSKERKQTTGGVKVQLVLHNSLDQKLVMTGVVRATVKKVNLRSSFPLKHDGTQFRVKAGSCYGIVKEVDFMYELLKEKTPTPPNTNS